MAMQKIKTFPQFVMGIDEAGRAARQGEPRPAFVIGIDEAGRGPLAGPLAVAGVKMKRGSRTARRALEGIKDSKKLSEKKREEWFAKIISNPNFSWAVSVLTPKTIDRINIARAANLGAYRVSQKLGQDDLCHVMMDGSLFLPSGILQSTIIRGDEKIPLISAASIIAKVTRDRIMRRIHKKYPQYGFDIHKGYGTTRHRYAIKKHGASSVHRKSFL